MGFIRPEGDSNPGSIMCARDKDQSGYACCCQVTDLKQLEVLLPCYLNFQHQSSDNRDNGEDGNVVAGDDQQQAVHYGLVRVRACRGAKQVQRTCTCMGMGSG